MVDRLNDQVEYLTGLTESMGTRMESTLDFVEKVFSAQQKDYVLDGENGTGPARKTEQLPARFHVSERRTRDSVGTNAPETICSLRVISGEIV